MMMLTQPIKRISVFLGQIWALITMLSVSFLIGTIGGAAYYGFDETLWTQLILLMVCGVFLNAIFTSIAYVLAVKSSDKVRGIGLAMFIWLFMAVVYDGLLLAYFYSFGQYPVENHAIAFTLLNPIDLSRVVVMLQMDVSALMGYTGAVFKSFFGNIAGLSISLFALIFWVLILQFFLWISLRKKDF